MYFDPKHAEFFRQQWPASGYTINQLFFLLLDPYMPGGQSGMYAASDVVDLAYQLALLVPQEKRRGIYLSRGIFRDPAKPAPEEVVNMTTLENFVNQYRHTLDNQNRLAKSFSKGFLDDIIEMTADWPKE